MFLRKNKSEILKYLWSDFWKSCRQIGHFNILKYMKKENKPPSKVQKYHFRPEDINKSNYEECFDVHTAIRAHEMR